MSIFFVAEIGINHNGDMQICKQLIDAAVDALRCVNSRSVILIVSTQEYLGSHRESP